VRSAESWAAYAKREGLIAEDDATPAANKFHAVRTVIDGLPFASRKESEYYRLLDLRRRAGEIADLKLQPKYPLHVMELWRSTYPIVITTVGVYTADFEYVELTGPAKGEIVTVDVKSPATAASEAYRLRKKLVEAIHGITITEV
jgi:hypothetical protein